MLIRSKARHVWHSPKFVLEKGDNRVEAIPPQALSRIRQLAEAREIDILGDPIPLPSQAEAVAQYHELQHLKLKVEGLTSELEGLKADHARVGETLNERNAEVNELRVKLEEATDNAKELSVQVESLEQENQSLTARLAELEPPTSERGEAGDDHAEAEPAEAEGEPDAEGKPKHGKRKR